MKGNSAERALYALQCAQAGLSRLKTSLPELERAVTLCRDRSGKVVTVGVGKSAAIAEKVAATLTSLGHRSVFLHPVEALHGDIGALSEDDIILALSFSGESREVVRLVAYAKKHFGSRVICFTGAPRSALARISDVCVEIRVRKEGSPDNLAPMASTTAMLVLGDMFSSALAGERFRKEMFAKFHPGGGLALSLAHVGDVMVSGKDISLVAKDEKLLSALKLMTKKKFKGVAGVIDREKKLIGVVTDGDIRRFLISREYDPNASIARAMSRRPKTISRTATLAEALRIMEKHKITALFVADEGGRPVGAIHIHDIVESDV